MHRSILRCTGTSRTNPGCALKDAPCRHQATVCTDWRALRPSSHTRRAVVPSTGVDEKPSH
eukprot:12539842-Alexandrium_andersonii.AAC.1